MLYSMVPRSRYVLDGSADGAQNDREVQGPRLAPSVQDLIANGLGLDLGQALDRLEIGRVPSNEGTLPEERKDVGELVVVRKLIDIPKHLVGRQVGERVLDPGVPVSTEPSVRFLLQASRTWRRHCCSG